MQDGRLIILFWGRIQSADHLLKETQTPILLKIPRPGVLADDRRFFWLRCERDPTEHLPGRIKLGVTRYPAGADAADQADRRRDGVGSMRNLPF